MIYYLKKDFLTWGERFSVTDESARAKFHVTSELFAMGKSLTLTTLGGNPMTLIKQKVWNLAPTFGISGQGREYVKLSIHGKSASLSKDGIRIEGNLGGFDYTVKDKSGAILCTVSPKWFTLGDAYAIDIASGADEALMLSSVLAVAAWADKRDKDR